MAGDTACVVVRGIVRRVVRGVDGRAGDADTQRLRGSAAAAPGRSHVKETTTSDQMSTAATATAPAWFRRALAVPFEHRSVAVDGASIHYLAWGEPGRRGLVFVHGGGAHAHWWSHLAATFVDEFRVLALDLSGHGDSGHRQRYELTQWTDEVVAVAADGGLSGPPVVIGHSM